MSSKRGGRPVTGVDASGLLPILRERGISNRWLARRIGVNEGYLSHVLQGRRRITEERAARAAELLGIPLALVVKSTHVAFDATQVDRGREVA
jgi:transcriptional regulator with XRE-family HTH domain